MARTMLMPKLNEAGDPAVVSGWMVKVGDRITLDIPVIAMETEKVTVEVAATLSGMVTRLLVQVGDVVKVGQPILEVE
jgi:pyruvate/2-oxoglutarate dehydrogenase complex dihydrolipoamide acyltransferase (E2) component